MIILYQNLNFFIEKVFLLYSCNTNTSGNVIKDNDEWNTLFVIKICISHFILEKGPQFVVSWEIDGETYTQREDFFFPYLLPGARGCQLLRPLASWDTSDRLCVPHSTAILCTLSKSDHVVLIMWSSSSYTPVVTNCPDVLSYPCLLITAWQLVKAHWVTRNELKIHVKINLSLFLRQVLIHVVFCENG